MLLLYVSFIEIIISFLLIFYSFNNFRGNIYLAIFFFLDAIWGIVNFSIFGDIDSPALAAIMYGHFGPLFYLIGPCLYFYVRSIVWDNHKLSKTDWIHFIPFFVLIIGNLPYLFSDFHGKIILVQRIRAGQMNIFSGHVNAFVSEKLNAMLRNIQYVVYDIAAIILFFRNRKILKIRIVVKGHQYKLICFYIKVLLLGTLFFRLVILVFRFYQVNTKSNLLASIKMTFYLVHGMAWFYLVLSVILFFIPEILYGLPRKQMNAKQVVPENFNQDYKEEVKIEISKTEDASNYSQIFTDDYMEEMGVIILKYLESKPYLDPGFNQIMMSVAIGLPMHHLSYYFNHVINQKFTNWRNNFRVRYAKELIESGKAELFSLDSIGKDCGFSNYTTFIKAFKQQMKVTPGDYIRPIK